MTTKLKLFFSTFLKILGLTAGCLLVAFLIVWPLWKVAISNPKIYTIFVLVIIFILTITSIILRIKRNAKKQKNN